MSETHPTSAALLHHTGWMHALALRLVRDASRADDIVQQALLRALSHPPRDAAALPAWLARVTRNEALQWSRSEGAREKRERRVGRHRVARPTSDVVERTETHRRVVDAVLSLEEPFRTVVLLRYFDGLEPKAIAKHLGWAPGTVRSRLKRGLERLRGTLDDRAEGDRRGWVFSLLPLVDPQVLMKGGVALSSAAAGGALLVTTKLKTSMLILALVVLLAGAVGWLARDRGEGGTAVTPSRTEMPDAPETARLAGRAGVDAPDPAPAPAAEPEPRSAPLARLRFTDGGGGTLDPDEVVLRYAEAGLAPGAVLVSEGVLSPTEVAEAAVRRWRGSSEGRRAVTWTRRGGGLEVALEAGRWRLFVARPGAAPFLTDAFDVPVEGDPPAVEIPLPQEVPAVTLRLVAAETGDPLSGAEIVPYFEFGDDLAFFEGPGRKADREGVVRVPRQELKLKMPRSREPSWWAVAPGRLARVGFVGPQSGGDAERTVPVPRTATVAGRAYRQDGEPAVELEVVWTRKGRRVCAQVDAAGRFRMDGLPAGRTSQTLYLLEDPANMRVGQARVDVRPGETTETVIGTPAQGEPRTAIHGRITAGGRPVPGAMVFSRPADASRKEKGSMARTDADGRYRLVVPRGVVQFGVFFGGADDFYIRSAEGTPLDLDGDVRQLDFDLPGGSLLVELVDADTGEPVPGAGAYAAPGNRDVEAHRFEGFLYRAGWAAMSDPRGEVLLIGLVPGEPHEVRAGAEGYAKTREQDVEPSRLGEPPPRITLRLQRR